jgi:hypothetical protein
VPDAGVAAGDQRDFAFEAAVTLIGILAMVGLHPHFGFGARWRLGLLLLALLAGRFRAHVAWVLL